MTEQLRDDVNKDHPDNIVGKLVGHQVHNGKLWFMCRWRDFTAEIDSPLEESIILEDCPQVLLDYKTNKGATLTLSLIHI